MWVEERVARWFDRVWIAALFMLVLVFAGVALGCSPAMAADTKPGLAIVNDFPPARFSCAFTTAATTSTAITGCTAPGAGLARYVTNVQLGGGVAVGATAPAIVQFGTGSNCGTGTTIVYRCFHGATAQCDTALLVPIKLGVNTDACLLDAATGTKAINLQGYVAP